MDPGANRGIGIIDDEGKGSSSSGILFQLSKGETSSASQVCLRGISAPFWSVTLEFHRSSALGLGCVDWCSTRGGKQREGYRKPCFSTTHTTHQRGSQNSDAQRLGFSINRASDRFIETHDRW